MFLVFVSRSNTCCFMWDGLLCRHGGRAQQVLHILLTKVQYQIVTKLSPLQKLTHFILSLPKRRAAHFRNTLCIFQVGSWNICFLFLTFCIHYTFFQYLYFVLQPYFINIQFSLYRDYKGFPYIHNVRIMLNYVFSTCPFGAMRFDAGFSSMFSKVRTPLAGGPSGQLAARCSQDRRFASYIK